MVGEGAVKRRVSSQQVICVELALYQFVLSPIYASKELDGSLFLIGAALK